MSEIKLTPLRLAVLRAVADAQLARYWSSSRQSYHTRALDGSEVHSRCVWLMERGLIRLNHAASYGHGLWTPWVITDAGREYLA